MTVNSLKDEIRFLFSGQGMPYEKVCIMVATVIALVLGTMLSSNIAAAAETIAMFLTRLSTLPYSPPATSLRYCPYAVFIKGSASLSSCSFVIKPRL